MSHLQYTTNNTALALALHTIGVPLLGVWNVYDEATLARIGVANIAEAQRKNLPGQIHYFFERIEGLKEIVAAFYEQQKADTERKPTEVDVDPKIAVRVVCAALSARKEFVNLWREQVPMLMATNGVPETVKKDAYEGTITHPGLRIVSANASKATKERLGF